ncbi:MAG TPA: GGDEF domain-containing protein [Treponemataceae bacterium]|nr:GGDEF domain-containing protein [Treponemataceae bacterium]
MAISVSDETRGILPFLSGVELFSTLLDDDLEYLASRSRVIRACAGTTLFAEGEFATRFFILTAGSVTLTQARGEPAAVDIARFAPGDVFGEFHFAASGLYNATAVATVDSELIAFPGNGLNFDRIADEKPDTAARILLKSIGMIETRIASTKALIAGNEPWIRELKSQIYADPATGLWNLHYMETELPSQLSGTTAAIMVKPDKFKEVNDALGHEAGDGVLASIAGFLMGMAARGRRGWAVRLRSNEMCLVAPVSGSPDARRLAEEIAREFPQFLPASDAARDIELTASVAFGVWPDDNPNWKALVARTNGAMQEAWRAGGDRVVTVGEAES